MALYAKPDRVKALLRGKIRFTDDPAEENKMSDALFQVLISEAESELHVDLSQRYMNPFQTVDGTAFGGLGEYPTRQIIRTCAELKATIRCLETEFGRGSTTDSSKYTETLEKRYAAIVAKLVEKRKINGQETNQWAYPPLPGLRLSWGNTAADDGFAGQVLIASGDSHRDGYAQGQINSPGAAYWSGDDC